MSKEYEDIIKALTKDRKISNEIEDMIKAYKCSDAYKCSKEFNIEKTKELLNTIKTMIDKKDKEVCNDEVVKYLEELFFDLTKHCVCFSDFIKATENDTKDERTSENLIEFYKSLENFSPLVFKCFYIVNDNAYKILYTPSQADYPALIEFTVEFVDGIMQLNKDDADAFRKEVIANYIAGSEKIMLVEDDYCDTIETKGYVIIDDITF